MIFTEKDKKLFWIKVNKFGPNGCWIWTGSLFVKGGGYGIFERRRNGVRISMRAHRVAYELIIDKIPDNLILRHTCDNPPCVNPEHLLPGTYKDNAQDMVNRKRMITQRFPDRIQRGENHWTARKGTSCLPRGELDAMSKLTELQVLKIRHQYIHTPVSQRNLAKEYGVSQSLIWQIVNNNYWKHLCL